MPADRIVNLRHRHRDLRRQDLETDEELREASKGVLPEATGEFDAATGEIEDLRERLRTLLANRVSSLIEDEEVLEEANGLLTQIVFKQRSLWSAMMKRQG